MVMQLIPQDYQLSLFLAIFWFVELSRSWEMTMSCMVIIAQMKFRHVHVKHRQVKCSDNYHYRANDNAMQCYSME